MLTSCHTFSEMVVVGSTLSRMNRSTYRSFTTTGSQLKICDFSGETSKGFEVLQFSMSATTQLLSSGEFRELRYDTTPVKSASANVSFYTNNSKMPNFELRHSRRKWMICGENDVKWKLFQTMIPYKVLTTQCLTICIWSTMHSSRQLRHWTSTYSLLPRDRTQRATA